MAEHCPSRQELEHFDTGLLDEKQAGSLVEHLDHCVTCDDTL